MDDKPVQAEKGVKQSGLTLSLPAILAVIAYSVADALNVGLLSLEIVAFIIFLGPPLYLLAKRLYLMVKR